MPRQKINVDKLVSHHRRMSLKADYASDCARKPLYSYAALICLAMRDVGRKMTLSQIYRWISDNFAYYRTGDTSWQVGGLDRAGLDKTGSPPVLPSEITALPIKGLH